MKTINFLSYSLSLKVSRVLLVLCCVVNGTILSFAQLPLTIIGEQNPCPMSTHTYTISGTPSNATSFKVSFDLPFGGNSATWNFSQKTVTVTFNNNSANLPDKLYVIASNLGGNNDLAYGQINFRVSAPSPTSPNGGNILVCPNGLNVSLTTSTSFGCGFRCQYVCKATPGVTLQANGNGNTGNQITVFPGNLPNLLS